MLLPLTRPEGKKITMSKEMLDAELSGDMDWEDDDLGESGLDAETDGAREEGKDSAGSGKTNEFPVDLQDAGSRLDVFLASKMQDRSRSFLRKLITEGQVFIGRASGNAMQSSETENRPVTKAGQKLKAGQIVRVILPSLQPLLVEPEDIPLDILYEDEDVIVVNKPKGMVVHPAAGHYTGTLVNALLYHCKGSLSGIGGVLRPGIVHRIDKDTTGSLVAAKNDQAHNSLAAQLKEHSITRRYRAIVNGNLKTDEGVIDAPIARHPVDRKKMAVCERGRGKEAVTHYKVLERFGSYTYIECRLETGRTHQIRVHMSHIGHPLLGDTVYGPSKCPYQLEGQTLHAMVLGFVHPRTGAYMEFTAPLPDYFQHLLDVLRARSAR